MPLQNRVTPWGDIVALPERGLFIGNRGCLHDGHRRVVKSWARAPWVTCRLQFWGRHRAVMAPGQYTELFSLDEATALAAGHRPCATCRRADYDRCKALWLTANADLPTATDRTMAAIDRLLHPERADTSGRKRTWSARLGDLPDGAMAVREGTQEPLLVQGGALHPWTPAGYGPPQKASPDMPLQVLTPPSVVKVLACGYRPVVHPSVGTPVAMPVPPTPARTVPVSEPAVDRLTPETAKATPVAGCKPELPSAAPPADMPVNSAF